MARNSWYNYEQHADSTKICTLLQLPKLQLWLQSPPPSSSSSSPPPAAFQPELGLPAQSSASSPVGISSAYPSASPGQHCGAWSAESVVSPAAWGLLGTRSVTYSSFRKYSDPFMFCWAALMMQSEAGPVWIGLSAVNLEDEFSSLPFLLMAAEMFLHHC